MCRVTNDLFHECALIAQVCFLQSRYMDRLLEVMAITKPSKIGSGWCGHSHDYHRAVVTWRELKLCSLVLNTWNVYVIEWYYVRL